VTKGQLPQRAGSLGLNGGGTAAAVPPRQSVNNSTRTLTYVVLHLRLYRQILDMPNLDHDSGKETRIVKCPLGRIVGGAKMTAPKNPTLQLYVCSTTEHNAHLALAA